MSYLAQFKAYSSLDTRGRAAFAALKLARDVINEDASASNYQQRRNLAEAVMADPVSMGEAVLRQCLLNPVIAQAAQDDGTLTSTDADLEYTIASSWDALAAQMRF